MLIKTVFSRIAIQEVYFGVGSNSFEMPLVAGDTGPKLRFNLLDSTGAAIAVSGGGVKLYLERASQAGHTNLGHEDCSGFDIANGLWDYSLQAGDISGAGTYFGEVEITYSDGTVETAFEDVRFLVRSKS